MKYLLALLLVLASGCTPLVVKEPIGSDFSPKELKAFEGACKLETEGEDALIMHLKKMDRT